jgi:hypothetical protein
MLLGLLFPTPKSKRLMLVHHTGRVTGKHYRQPVSYVRDGDILLTPGGGIGPESFATANRPASDYAAKTSQSDPTSSPIRAEINDCSRS